MMTLNRLFPAPHTYGGVWQSIYLEPIVGSGERLSIAVVACGNDGQFQVVQSLRNEVIEGIYGEKAEQFQGIIDWVIQSIHKHLSAKNTLDSWIAPIEGVHSGVIRATSASSLTGILKQAIMQSASFGTLALEAEHDDAESEYHKKSQQHWSAQITELVKMQNPTYASYFKKKVRILNSNTLTSYDFLDNSHAFNFGLLKATQNLNTLKAKLLDLGMLKKSPFTTGIQCFELIVGSSPLDDPTLTEREIEKQENSLAYLIEAAASEEVSVHRVFSSQEAADRLLSKLAA